MKKFLLFMLLSAPLPAFGQLVLPSGTGVVQAPIDANGWTSYKLVLTQNVTSFSFVILPNGTPPPSQAIRTVEFVENSGGGFTVTFASNISNPCTISTGANAVTVCQFTFDAANNAWTGIGGGGGGFSKNQIDAASSTYGVLSNGQVCFGTNVTVTNNSTTVSCSTALFSNADLGKRIFSTNGGGGVLNQVGSTVQANSTIASVTNTTTVVLAAAATGTLSANVNAVLFWASPDDNAWDLVDTAVQNYNGCPNVIVPSGLSLVERPHFQKFSATCAGAGVTNMLNTNDIAVTYSGLGLNSTLVLGPNFSFTNCTVGIGSVDCFFNSSKTIIVSNLNFWGGGNSLTSTTHANNLIGLGTGAQTVNLTAMGFGASSTSLVGIFMATVRSVNTVCDGFGRICETMGSGGGPNVLFFNFAGDTAGQNLDTGSSGTITYDYGGLYGVTSGTVNLWVEAGTTYNSFGAQTFGACTGTNNSQSLYNNGGTVNLTGGTWTCGAGGTTYGHVITSGGVTHARGVTFTGTTGGLSVQSGAKFFDDGGNTFGGTPNIVGNLFGNASITGTACATGNFALTSGWGTSSVTSVTANGDIRGCHVTITGAAGAAGPVLTWTYPTAPAVAPASCHLVGVSGTLTGVATGTPGATSVAFTFAGTPSAQTYVFDVGCP